MGSPLGTPALKSHLGAADVLMGNLSLRPEQPVQPSAEQEQTVLPM